MALTKVKSGGITDATIATADIADSAVTAAKVANNAITTAKINNSEVTNAKLAANAVTADKINNGEISTAKIADTAVTLAKLEHGTSSNDGKFLRANNGADPTFETVSGTTINNNADNRVITGSGTANTLNGEANLIFDGTDLGLGDTPNNIGSLRTFHIKGPSGQGAGIRLQDHGDTADSDDFTIYKNYAAAYLRVNGSDPLVAYLNGADRVRIDSSGRVMIGTDTEGNGNGDELTIHKASGNMGMTLRSGDSSNSHIYFSDATSGAGEYAGYIAYQHSDNSMHIGTNSSERIHIKSDGKVGIGMSNPDDTLDVNGTFQVSSNAYISGTLYALGNDIRIGGTGTGNSLNDYEEGTYTPTLTGYGSTTNLDLHSSESTLAYVKIGNNCWITGRIRLNNANYSGYLRMSLPFAALQGTNCSNCTQSAVNSHGVIFSDSIDKGLFFETYTNTSLGVFLFQREDTGWTNATNAHIQANHYLTFNHYYRTQ